MEYRKVIVTACRLRLPYDLPHPDLDKAFYDLDAFYHDGAIIDIDTFKRHVRRFSSKPIRSSLLLSLALCEQMQDTKTCEEVIRTSCLKEFDAATLPTCGQQLNYSSLLDNMSGKLSILSVGHPIVTNRFIGFLQRFKSEVSSDRFPPMLPTFGKKTLARSSCEVLSNRLQLESVDYHLTTQDLEYYYSKTGEELTGPSELRSSWKFGDLKARVYYAMGATHYFASRYMKYISYRLTYALECTNPRFRYNVSRLDTTFDDDGDLRIVLVTYDYKSFTTTLEELRYFVSFLADFFLTTRVFLMDLFSGPFHDDLGDLLHRYNNACNIRPSFDTFRLAEFLGVEDTYESTRGGLLGVNGNINLALLLHGLHLSTFDDNPASKSVVGDDSLVKVRPQEVERLINHVNDLIPLPDDLAIHPDKFKMMLDEHNLPFEEVPGALPLPWQYLKAPLSFSGSEIRLLPKLPFPNLALVFSLSNRFRTTFPATLDQVVHKFLSQLSTWFTACNRCFGDVKEDKSILSDFAASHDFVLVRHVLLVSYKRLGLDPQGSLPGRFVKVPKIDPDVRRRRHRERRGKPRRLYQSVRLTFIVPNILNPSSYCDDWIATVAETQFLPELYMPVYSEFSVPAGVCLGVGHSFKCTPHRIQRIAVDMGFLESEVEYKLYRFEGLGDLEWLLRRMIMAKLRPLVQFYCIQEPPTWYNSYVLTFDSAS